MRIRKRKERYYERVRIKSMRKKERERKECGKKVHLAKVKADGKLEALSNNKIRSSNFNRTF